MYCKKDEVDFVKRTNELDWCGEWLPYHIDLNDNLEFIVIDNITNKSIGKLESQMDTAKKEYTKLGIAVNHYVQVLVVNHIVDWSR